MNWINLLWIFYFAAHTAAGVFYLILAIVLFGVREAGLWAWGVPVGCLVLLALDLSGRISLRGSGAKTLAALLLPFLCSCAEVLLWDDQGLGDGAPAVLAWVFSPLLLAGYALLRRERRESPLAEAEALLLYGSGMGVVEAIWLIEMAGAVAFMATFGLPVSLFVGGLISSRNGLLDYCGVKGILVGLLAFYVIQCMWYWKGTRLLRKNAPELAAGVPLFSLLLPMWNLVQARKLARRLQLRDVKGCY